MGAAAQSNIVQYLTEFAQGYGLGAIDPTAGLIAPIVRVSSPTGKYKSFDSKNAFQVPNTTRAIGGPSQRIEFSAADADYNCTPNSLEIGIDDIERAAPDQLGIEQGKVKTLITTAARAHAVAVADAAATLSAAATPTWSSGSTAVADINGQIEAIVTAIGAWPTHIVMGVTAWKLFVGNSSVTDKIKSGIVTPDAIRVSGILLCPAEIVVSPLIKDSAKPGAAKSTAQVYGSNVYLFHSTPSPTQWDPTWMKTFRTAEGGVEDVRMYRDDKAHSDIYQVNWTQDIKIVSSLSAKRLTVS